MPFTFLMLPPQTGTTRAWAGRLAADLPFVRVVAAEDEAEALAALPAAEAAFGTLPPRLLAAAGRLRWLQAPQAAPPAGYYTPELVAHPATVTNMREIYNDHIGAHILAFVLAFARDFHTYLPAQMQGRWRPRPNDTGVIALGEATALIVGLGGIGAEAARLLAACGVRVLATDARRTAPTEGVAELHPPAALDDLLGRADFVILTVPHTPATEGFMHRDRFRRMKRGAFFINIGRGRTTQAGRSAGRAARGRDRRRRPRCVRDRAAAAGPSVVDHAGGADHAPHRRLRPASGRAALRDHRRQLPRLRSGDAAAQPGGQGELVLTPAGGDAARRRRPGDQRRMISTRRFCGSRTSGPVGTSGWVSPKPLMVIVPAATPSRTSSAATARARRSDSARL